MRVSMALRLALSSTLLVHVAEANAPPLTLLHRSAEMLARMSKTSVSRETAAFVGERGDRLATHVAAEETPTDAPTESPKCLACHIANAVVVNNNLGNLGPDQTNDPTIILENFAMYGAQNVTLMISNLTQYVPKAVGWNGKNQHGFGMINIETGTDVKLRFEFLIDGSPASLDNVPLSFYDLDSNNKGDAHERMGVYDTTPYVTKFLDADTEIDELLESGLKVFMSTKPGNGNDNPTDPLQLTSQEKQRAVQLLFRGKSHIDVLVGTTGEGGGGRNMMYACLNNLDAAQASPEMLPCLPAPTDSPTESPTETPTDAPTETPTDSPTESPTNLPTETPTDAPTESPKCLACNLANAVVVNNNLGNLGPDQTNDPTIILENFAMYGAKNVTLKISNTSMYVPKASHRNGKNIYGFGIVNVKAGAEVKLRFEFFIDGSPASLDNVPMSFFDLDSNNKMDAHERMGVYDTTPWATKILDSQTELVYIVEHNAKVFMSSLPGNGNDNPTDPLQLTRQQKQRAVQFLFRDVAHIDVLLGSSGSGRGGRNLMFACLTNLDGLQESPTMKPCLP